jgi:hypothetical protein
MRPVRLTVTCQACPWQAEGQLDDGRVFYMRHRFCRASLGFGDTLDDAVDDSFGNEIDYHDNNEDCGKPPGQGFCSGLYGEEIAYVWNLLVQVRDPAQP